MTDNDRRVAVLARPGVAGDRLRELLAEAGIQTVLQADPTTLELDVLSAAGPQVVLIALDPAIEEALERFDAVLGDPAVNVIYEEADLAALREGWDAARWKRHLLAKLEGHDRVLPPRPDGQEDAPGLVLHSVEEVSDEAYAAFDAAAFDTSVGEVEFDSDADTDTDTDRTFAPSDASSLEHAPAAAPSGDSSMFDPVLAESLAEPDIDTDTGDGIQFIDEGDDNGRANAQVSSGFEISFETDPVEDDNAGLEGAAAGLTGGDVPEGGAFDVTITFDTGPDASPSQVEDVAVGGLEAHLASHASTEEPPAMEGGDTPPDASAPATGGFGELSLDDGDGTYTRDVKVVDDRFNRDLADLDERIAALELVEDAGDADTRQAQGAVLVMAGIGGPDAVRQLLGALPMDFTRPVLVQQRLDGGRYDRLVAQMQRATTLPVRLAEPGQLAMAGFVYVLPSGLGIRTGSEAMRFEAEGEVLAALPAADSAVLMFSGSDPADVDLVLKHHAAGALVAGQSPDGCYDAAAPDQLVARGGDTGQPAELAQRLAERWPA